MSNNYLWKPDKDTAIALSGWKKKKRKPTKADKKRAKRKKAKELKDRKDKARQKLIQFFGLQRYPTNMAICLCIHNQYAAKMPANDKEAWKLILAFAGQVNGKRKRFYTDKEFYSSNKWREIRYIALQQSGGACNLCGARSSDGVQLHVDHIVPRSIKPKLQYDLNNLQVLCEDCNLGKSNYDDTDWR